DQSGDATVTISQAGSTTTVSAGDTTYDGSEHGATANWASTGTDGEGAPLTVHYMGINGTVYDSDTAPTNPRDYRTTATYAGHTNHTGSSDSDDFTIAKADVTISVTGYDVTYDGTAHTATGSATGVNSEDLSDLLTLSGTTHTNAGAYADSWS